MDFYTNVHCSGKYILFRGIEDGRRVQRKEIYMPSLFLPSSKKTEYTTLDGKYVERKVFDDPRDARDYIQSHKDIHGFKYYGLTDFTYTYISDKYGSIQFDEYRKKHLNIGFLDIEVESSNGFPEPALAAERVNAIGMYYNEVYYVFGLEHDYTPKRKDVVYRKYDTEYGLLKAFIQWWRDVDFDVITGWNVDSFDMTYLINRCNKVLGEEMTKNFSPWGWMREQKLIKRGQEIIRYDIQGLAVVDYLDIYRKSPAIPERENYKLDFIAEVELGENKLSYEEYGSLYNLYNENWELFIDYNIKDVELVKRLDDKLKLLDLTFTMAYDAGINFTDVASQTKSWDIMIYNELKSRKMVIPSRPERKESSGGYAGAYVKDPIKGFHEWVVSFDLASLYPHLIMQYSISPETIIDDSTLYKRLDDLKKNKQLFNGDDVNQEIEDLEKLLEVKSIISVDKYLEESLDLSFLKRMNMTLCPSGTVFDVSKRGFLAEMMDKLYKERKKFKKMMLNAQQERENTKKGSDEYKHWTNEISKYDNIQMSRKISLNSAYGAIGFQYFRYYDVRIAESITLAGQLSIRWIEKCFNKYFNKLLGTENYDYVVAIDTDSNYLRLKKLVDNFFDEDTQVNNPNKIVKFIDSVCKDKIEPYINKSYERLAEYVNAYEQKMFMEREAIANKGIWTAKKRYILNVFNNEGVQYTKPKMKIMGIESVRSSTPGVVRKYLEESFDVIINKTEDDMIKYIADKRIEFGSLPVQDVSSPTSVNGLDKWADSSTIWKSSCPKHVKGALVYNKIIDDKNLSKYQHIRSGDKCKTMPLKEPNSAFSNSITFPDGCPKEFGLDKFFDYEEQWKKTYLSPLEKILDVIGWETEKKQTLTDFFGA